MSALNLLIGLPPSNDHGNLFETVNERPYGPDTMMTLIRPRWGASNQRPAVAGDNRPTVITSTASSLVKLSVPKGPGWMMKLSIPE